MSGNPMTMRRELRLTRAALDSDVVLLREPGKMIGEAADISANEVRPLVDEVQHDVRKLMAAHRHRQQEVPGA